MGLPFAVTLFRPELDQWAPGEHNGTFRGNNHAFVTARAALERFWSNGAFEAEVRRRGDRLAERLEALAEAFGFSTRGRGMMRGLVTGSGELAAEIARAAFAQGLLIETSGADDEVLKVLAPLTIQEAELDLGLDILEQSIRRVTARAAGIAAE
jgi:diaminobutyrate-2-oxoglutarate transaminase